MEIGTVVCGCEQNYTMPLAVMLRSLAESLGEAARQPVVILDGGMSARSQERLWASLRDTSIDLGNAPLAAVQDAVIPTVGGTAGLPNWRALGFNPEAPFFNGGVLLFNIARWRRDGLSSTTLEYAATHGELLRHADQ